MPQPLTDTKATEASAMEIEVANAVEALRKLMVSPVKSGLELL